MKGLILALDVPTPSQACSLIKKTQEHVDLYKVGLQLFLAGGPKFVQELSGIGVDIMLDLKLHDIPNTVAEATKRIVDMPAVKMFTVHAQAGHRALDEASVCITRDDLKMLAVTILTSHDRGSLYDIGYSHGVDVWNLTLRLKRLAVGAGAAGIVCSPMEVAALKDEQTLTVCPGVRFLGDDVGDQKRIGGPKETVARGADYIVVGRPIREDPDPGLAAKRFALAIEQGRKERE